MMRFRFTRGFTLIEMMVTVAVLAIIISIAAPSFNGFFDRYRVKRAADTLSAFLINAKSEAIKRNKNVSTVITGSGNTWCAGMTENATCDCSATPNTCQIEGADRVIKSTSFKGVQLLAPASESAFVFKSQRGTVEGFTAVQLESANGSKLNVDVSIVGRIRLCSPSGTGNMGGYTVCPTT